jgi:formylglycine-generating enzyme required for sulfatase activity
VPEQEMVTLCVARVGDMRRNLAQFAYTLLLVCAFSAADSCLAGEESDREFQECTKCPAMLAIPAGRFVMGSPAGEAGRFDSEGPQHIVSVKAFALGKFDVTTDEFLAFLEASNYQLKACNTILNTSWHSFGNGFAYSPDVTEPPRWPAVCLDWHDAQAYLAWINQRVRDAHPAIA